jgi:VanZ family protein
MNRKVTAVLRIVPMVLTMGTIFFLSHQPGDRLTLPPLPGIDKLAHMLIYGFLAATVFFALSEQQKNTKPRSVMLLIMAVCFLYGISDEYHQSFIPGRFVSILDLLADCAGAAMTCALWGRWRRRIATIGIS